MRRIISGLALALTTLGLAACGSSNDPATNAMIGDDPTLNEELPADEGAAPSDNSAIGDNAFGNGY